MQNSWSAVAVVVILTFIISVVVVYRFRQFALAQGLVDNPNERSSHKVATPRGGGLAFVVIWGLVNILFTAVADWPIEHAMALLPGAFFVAAIGYLDDRRGIAPGWRALVHFGAALGCVTILGGMDTLILGDLTLNLGWLGTVFGAIAIVWSVNLYNFMDGTDGIAGVEGLFVLCIGGAILWQAGGAVLAMSAWILAASIGGFLVWNWPKASIFMGDVGSGFLGFMVAAFAFAGEKWYGVPILVWAILYTVFWFDATATLLRRIVAGERWYSAHRSHAYQRLHHDGGWSHGKILWAVIGLNLLFSCLAIYGNAHHDVLVWVLFGAIAVASFFYYLAECITPRR